MIPSIVFAKLLRLRHSDPLSDYHQRVPMFEDMLKRTAEEDDPVVLSDVESLLEVDESEFDSDF